MPEPGAYPDAVRRSLAHCRAVTRSRARNFYYGLMLTPEPKRSALYAVYALMRACDDCADGEDDRAAPGQRSDEATRARLEQFNKRLESAVAGRPVEGEHSEDGEAVEELWPAVTHVLKTYPIKADDLRSMMAGQRRDLATETYETFDQLYSYCYQVAGVVGLVSIEVWGYNGGNNTRKLAEQRGIALQLTNILRDVVEDARRNRVYLPTEDLKEFGYDPASFREAVLSGQNSEQFEKFIAFQAQRALYYYDISDPLDCHINAGCRATSRTLMKLYRGLLDKISKCPGRVLTERVRLSTPEKLWIALRGTWWQHSMRSHRVQTSSQTG